MFTHNVYILPLGTKKGKVLASTLAPTLLLLANFRYIGLRFIPKKSKQRYKFADDQQESKVYITIRILVKVQLVDRLNMDEDDVEVPFLLRLEYLDQCKIYKTQ